MKKGITIKTLRKYWYYGAIAGLVVLLAATAAWAVSEKNQANQFQVGAASHSTGDTLAHLEEHGIVPLSPDQASNNKQTVDDLAYMIEEEKLAHDVYQAMYDKWGSRVFNNIKDSETMHQNMVLTVMDSRNLPDPRQSELGIFTNPDLQALYDQLIAQGNQSESEAFKVGVLVEETDIADLKETIARLDPKDTDVKDVLENLQHASENHLRAFNRQVER